MSHQYETSTEQRHHRYSSYSNESRNSNHNRRSGSDASDSSVNYLANHLKQTASFDYNQSRNSYHVEKENDSSPEHEYETKGDRERASLENNYSRAMSQMNRGDYGPVRQKQKKLSHGSSKDSRNKVESTHRRDKATNTAPLGRDRRVSQSTAGTQISKASSSKAVTIQVKKRSVSKSDPSEETIAIFGAYGVTGHYFLQRAIEAGYNIQAMILPGMEMEDVACSKSLRLITGSLNEVDKISEVVKNATYVVCLLNDCDHENFNPPIGNSGDGMDDFNNLNFMHNLVPILEGSGACRVLLYEASSLSLGNKGSEPVISTVIKKMGVKKEWRNTKREQDKIVKYITNQTKNTHFNYVITRPSGSIWDKPSRKKLAASKSQPGPFPITNTDLAEFTLSALKMQKVYNSCPYVVQDGI